MSRSKSKLTSEAKLILAYKTKYSDRKPYSKYRTRLRRLAVCLDTLKSKRNSEKLDTKKIYYTYVYLDPRYPAKFKGQYKYILPSGLVLYFSHKPFYVGKGKGSRMLAHLKGSSEGYIDSERNPFKTNVINKILQLGLEPIIIDTPSRFNEALALAFEIDMIAGIGRRDRKLGPLTNLTDGGEGTSGRNQTDEAKAKISLKLTGRPATGKGAKGIPHSAEWCAATSAAKMGKPGTGRAAKGVPKTGGAAKGVPKTGGGAKGVPKPALSATRALMPSVTCPHCDLVGHGGGSMTRYHFDNCKYK